MYDRILLSVLLLAAVVSCGDESEPLTDACGRTRRICDYNEATQQFDRNCRFVPPPDAGIGDCDAGSVIPAGGDAR